MTTTELETLKEIYSATVKHHIALIALCPLLGIGQNGRTLREVLKRMEVSLSAMALLILKNTEVEP